MQENYIDIISNIKEKLTEIILKFESVKDENLKLKKENEELIKEIKEKDIQFKELENKFNNSKFAGALVSDNGNEEAKSTINKLVREIDYCITLLNR